MTNTLKLLIMGASALALAAPASATLLLRGGFANAALSVDGWGNGGDANGLQANVPAGSTVVAAYLYSADIFGNNPGGDFTFAGSNFTWSSGTLLTPNANPANTRLFNVTSIVKPIIEGGPGGLYNFAVSESTSLDGEVLVVVYRNASTMGSTAIVLDGELSQGGDSTLLSFAAPYAGGDVFMSLASSFSFNGSTATNLTGQVTNVDVRTSSNPASRRLSSCAGGNDDANFLAADGSLITVGGVGDNPANPDPNCGGGAGDDEFYNLGLGNSADADPFLTAGDTFIEFLTNNPSFDDNVFGLFFSTTFAIDRVDDDDIDDDPIDTPEPGMLGLLGLGLTGLALRRRRKA